MFTIPADLTPFSVAGLRDLRNVAATRIQEFTTSNPDPSTVSDEILAEMEQLQDFITAADTEILARETRAAKFTKFSVIAEAPAVEAEAEVDEGETGEDGDGETDEATVTEEAAALAEVAAPGAAVTAASVSHAPRSVQIKDVARIAPTEVIPQTSADNYTIYAAADVPGVPSGKELGWDDLGQVFEARTRGYGASGTRRGKGGVGRQQHGLAVIERQMPDFQQVLENDGEIDLYRKLQEVATHAKGLAKARNDAVTAAVGWCAPSETVYSICNPVTAEGLLDLPEVVARRGGIRHNQGIDWVTFFGGSYPALDTNVPGMTILTEAQVIADTAKTCLEIDCPSFIDERLNVGALCLTGSLLQNRGYPEYVTEFTRGALAAFAHFVNREIIDILVDGSTAVTLNADMWTAADTTPTLASVMNAVELAVQDMRYRLRLGLNQPIDFVFPYWIRSWMRADYILRNAAANDDIADAEIAQMFARRGANVQYVMDWQDAFSGVAGGYGATTALQGYPGTSVQFLAFPPGTWILARQDVIRLDTVYDSVNLQQNLVTQLFMEDGWLPMRMCPLSRVYTVPICNSGMTAAQATILDCTPA